MENSFVEQSGKFFQKNGEKFFCGGFCLFFRQKSAQKKPPEIRTVLQAIKFVNRLILTHAYSALDGASLSKISNGLFDILSQEVRKNSTPSRNTLRVIRALFP